jgi:hypothetical protein
MRITPFALGVALFAMGCGSDFTPEYRLEKSRVLALQAEPAQPRFGTSSTLRSLIHLHGDDTVVSYHWSWCPLPTQSSDGYQCPVDQAGFEQMLGGLMAGQAAPSLDLGTGETATFTNAFPASTLAAICNANAGATLTAGEIDGGVAGNDSGVAEDASVSSEIPDGGVAEADAGGALEDGGTDAESVAANWSAPTGTPGEGAAGGIPLNKIFNCGTAGFPVTVRLEFQTASMEKPGAAVFKVYLPTDDSLPGNLNPVLGGLKLREATDTDPLAGIAMDQAGTVPIEFKRDFKYMLSVDMPPLDSESYFGWTIDNLGGFVLDEDKQHVLGEVQEILNLNWYVEAGDLGEFGGRRGGNTGYNPYAAAQQGFDKARENQWKTPLMGDYKDNPVKIYVLVRDSRGGVGWSSAAVTLESTP